MIERQGFLSAYVAWNDVLYWIDVGSPQTDLLDYDNYTPVQ